MSPAYNGLYHISDGYESYPPTIYWPYWDERSMVLALPHAIYVGKPDDMTSYDWNLTQYNQISSVLYGGYLWMSVYYGQRGRVYRWSPSTGISQLIEVLFPDSGAQGILIEDQDQLYWLVGYNEWLRAYAWDGETFQLIKSLSESGCGVVLDAMVLSRSPMVWLLAVISDRGYVLQWDWESNSKTTELSISDGYKIMFSPYAGLENLLLLDQISNVLGYRKRTNGSWTSRVTVPNPTDYQLRGGVITSDESGGTWVYGFFRLGSNGKVQHLYRTHYNGTSWSEWENLYNFDEGFIVHRRWTRPYTTMPLGGHWVPVFTNDPRTINIYAHNLKFQEVYNWLYSYFTGGAPAIA